MIATALATASRLIAGTTVHWYCDPHTSNQRIYFGNHSSHLDFIIIWSCLPPGERDQARPVAGRDYWTRGAVRRYLASRVFRAVLIQRRAPDAADARDAARLSVEHMAREMGTEDSLIVFPEGTRSRDGHVGPFKSGLYHLAHACPNAELVPVHLQNLNRILPKGEVLPVPMLSRVIFGPPLGFDAREDKHAFLERARAALVRLGAA